MNINNNWINHTPADNTSGPTPMLGQGRETPATNDNVNNNIEARTTTVSTERFTDVSQASRASQPKVSTGDWKKKPSAESRSANQPGLGTKRGAVIGRHVLFKPGVQRVLRRGQDLSTPNTKYTPKYIVSAGSKAWSAPRAFSAQEIKQKTSAAIANRKPIATQSAIGQEHRQRVSQLESKFAQLRLEQKKETTELPTLGGSANPVSRMHEESMIPANKFPTDFRPAPKNKAEGEKTLLQAYQKALQKTTSKEGKTALSASFGANVQRTKSVQRHKLLGNLPKNPHPSQIKGAFEQALPQLKAGIASEIPQFQSTIEAKLDSIDWDAISTVEQADKAINEAFAVGGRFQSKVDSAKQGLLYKSETQKESVVFAGTDDTATPKEITEHFQQQLEKITQDTKAKIFQTTRRGTPEEKKALDGLKNLEQELEKLNPEVKPTPRYNKQQLQAKLSSEANEKLNEIKGDFVTADQMEKAGVDNPQKILEESGLEAQYSLLESLDQAGGSSSAEKHLLAAADLKSNPGFAYKAHGGREGAENFNELRFQEHLAINGGNKFIAAKTQVQMQGVTIVTGKGDRYVDPEGIVSEFMADATPVNRDELVAYGKARQTVQAKLFKGEEISTDEKNALQAAEDVLTQNHSIESVIAHAMTDLEFWAGDNHQGQYMIQDGHLHNIDYARGNAPGEAELSKTASGNVETFATFKSVMLDHPHARNQPIPQDLVETLLARDIENEEKQLQEAGIIGDPEFFAMAAERMQEQENDSQSIATTVENRTVRWKAQEPSVTELRSLARKYGVNPEDIKLSAKGMDKIKFAGKIKEAVVAERLQFKNTLFRQDPPKGHQLRMQRVRGMQEYVKGCKEKGESPTFSGMRDHVLRDTFAPFLKVMERMDYSPAMNLGMAHDINNKAAPSPRSLEQLIRNAQEQGMASEEEVQQMHTALQTIQSEHSCTSEELRTAYYAF